MAAPRPGIPALFRTSTRSVDPTSRWDAQSEPVPEAIRGHVAADVARKVVGESAANPAETATALAAVRRYLHPRPTSAPKRALRCPTRRDRVPRRARPVRRPRRRSAHRRTVAAASGDDGAGGGEPSQPRCALAGVRR